METKRLGGLFDGETKHQAGSVWDKEFVAPTIDTMQGGYREPMIIEEPKCLNSKGGRSGIEGLQPSLQDRVYSTDAVSTAVTTSFMPCILEEKTIVAMRGRNPDNPSDKTAGSPTAQRLEPNSQGICNTLTSVQKDNMLLEKQIKVIGNYMESNHDASRVVDTDGIAPTVKENHGTVTGIVETVKIKQATKDGYIECKVGGGGRFELP